MSFFFPRTIYHSEAPLAPLFQLLNELEDYPQRRSRGCHAYRASQPEVVTWVPRFNVRETPEAWVLRGELPGLNKDHVSIELSDPQKLVVRGKFDPSFPESQPDVSDSASDATAESTHTEDNHSYQATVEDDTENDFEVVDEKAQGSPKPQAAPVEQTEQKQEAAHSDSEITFSRTFKFPTYVDQSEIAASLKDGLLTVVVPKPKKAEPVNIPIA
ncbi:HSP20-like chaperone [Stachybotrys elegans]|uniref:HSP20-like chaperone n=1 Tax=Stachybotrys elegans TaxID=80388 RepID=A0A8K0SAZ9_9HYPO|nr:HSP20-like chaperone [Stachybotrys elegans]